MARNKYETELSDRVTLGERIPAWFWMEITVSTTDTTPVDVTGHEFALTLQLDGTITSFALTPDMTDAADGIVSFDLDTNVAEAAVGVWDWDCVWVKGPDPDTDPIEISFGGQLTMQQGPTEVPA